MDRLSPKPSSLCEYCRPVFSLDRSLGRTILDGRKDYHPDYPALEASIAAGCEACRLLRYALQQKVDPKQLNRIHGLKGGGNKIIIKAFNKAFYPASFSDLDTVWGLSRLHVVVLWRESIEVDFWLKIYADEDSLTFKSNLVRNLLPDREPLCHHNLQKVKQLINHCFIPDAHFDCQLPYIDSSLPTRLIDVGIDTAGPVRLVSSERLPSSTQYVALSHCWGTKPFLSTTRATLRDREYGIDLQDLPANFHDSIIAVRALDLRYIWIDSLCIIQDDKEDWRNESQRMASVYSSAHITIVPVSAGSAHDGFLHNRKHFDHIYADLSSSVMQTDDIQDSIWDHRGWTFQERLLSKRLLYFTQNQLYFECHGSCWMENNTPPDLLRMIGNQPWRGVSSIIAKVYSDSEATIPDEWYIDWLEQYTQRKLTHASDRLPALQGLASVIGQSVSDLYIHGLWAKDLARGLVWRLEDSKASKIVTDVQTPTWSWARWQGAIRHETFIDFDGNVETAPCFKSLGTRNSDDGKTPHAILAIEGKLANVNGLIRAGSFPHKDGASTHIWLDDANIKLNGRKISAFLVSKTTMFEPEGNQSISTRPHCLLLDAAAGKPNRYERIGIMQLPDTSAQLFGGDKSAAGKDWSTYARWDEKHIFKFKDVQTFEIE
ncbi:HET-domain-containing protein [Venturia nashicola]|nr:HET-domain-containing protein [Venturia nashicola]